MFQLRKSAERGHANHGWLDSHHTFSFAEYQDPRFMGFSVLRVINEDRVAGGEGFGTHPHRDMEIVSYVIEGALEHKDSLGNSTTIRPGEVQRMSAGTGVRHSEFNPLPDQTSHFLQIWILPDEPDLEPGYGQKDFSAALRGGELALVVSRDGRAGSISVHQDVKLYVARPRAGATLTLPLDGARKGWIQMVSGTAEAGGHSLQAGDGLAIAAEADPTIRFGTEGHFLVFDLPA